MSDRLKINKAIPAAYQAVVGLEKYMSTATLISPVQKELIKIRASQINGCAYCVNQHSRDMRGLGESEQRVYLVSVWRESPQFTAEERIVLALTEEITLIHKGGLSDATYNSAVAAFGEEGTAQLIMAAITINAWNRIGVSTQMKPE